jgi:hypothetical protein
MDKLIGLPNDTNQLDSVVDGKGMTEARKHLNGRTAQNIRLARKFHGFLFAQLQ